MALVNPLLLAPVRFGATYYTLRSTQGSAADLRFPASGDLDADTDYYVSGDGTATDLLKMLDTCLTAHASTYSFNVTLNSDLRVEVETVSHGDLFTLEWAHASTTLDQAIFGYADANTVSAFRATATGRPSSMWRPARPPSEDSRDRQEIIASVVATMSGLQRTARLVAPNKERDVVFALLPQELVLDELSDATETTFETVFTDWLSYGHAFRWYPDETDLTSDAFALYKLREINAKEAYQRDSTHRLRWRVTLPMRRAD